MPEINPLMYTVYNLYIYTHDIYTYIYISIYFSISIYIYIHIYIYIKPYFPEGVWHWEGGGMPLNSHETSRGCNIKRNAWEKRMWINSCRQETNQPFLVGAWVLVGFCWGNSPLPQRSKLTCNLTKPWLGFVGWFWCCKSGWLGGVYIRILWLIVWDGLWRIEMASWALLGGPSQLVSS